MKPSTWQIQIVSLLLLGAGWQWLAYAVDQPELFPGFPQLVQTLMELPATRHFYQSLVATLARGLAGMLLSLTVALGLSLLFARYKWLHELFRPLLALMRSVPVISFILLALIFLNPESIPLMIAFLTMFPLLAENLTRGICHLRPELSIMAGQFQVGLRNRLAHVIYPQLKPYLFSGLASAAGFGWRAIIMGEVLAQCSWGIGSEMKRAQNFIAVPELLAWTLVAVWISFLFDKGIVWLSRQQPAIAFTPKERPTKQPATPLQANQIRYHYGIGHFSHRFEVGRIYGISAPSGKGKTTLLQLLGGILPPVEGTITPPCRTGIATVFQEPALLPHLSALQNILLPIAAYYPLEKARKIALDRLEMMELKELADRSPGELSYGQQQRVAIARALAYPSGILLMDEPFKGLDEALSHRIMDHIRTAQAHEPQIIIFTSHNREELRQMANEVIYL